MKKKDHIYIGDEPSEDIPLELLLEAMELSSYWRLTHFFKEVQRIIIRRRLMNPWTLDSSKLSRSILASDAKPTILVFLSSFFLVVC